MALNLDMVAAAPPIDATERRRLLAACLLTGFQPHAGQLKAIDAMSRARFVELICGRRWGKSKLLARRIVRQMLEPEQVVWNVAPTYDLSDRVFGEVVKLFKTTVPRALMAAGRPVVKVRRASQSSSLRLLEVSNGSTLQGKSADNPDSLLGTGLDLLVEDEAARIGQNIFEEYLLPALLDRGGKAVLISTPRGYDWLFDLFERGQPGPNHDPEWWSLQSPSWENPYLKREDIERFRSIMSRSSFDQEIGAQFTARSGRVFADFSRERHVRTIGYDPQRPVYVGVDFGFRHFAWVAMQTTAEGEAHVFADAVYEDHTTGQAGAKLAEQSWARNIEFIACDPAGNARNLQTGLTDVKVLRDTLPWTRVKFSTSPDHRSPEWRAARIRDLLLTAAGATRLYIGRSCRNTIAMFEASVYPEKATAKEEPTKDNVTDHTRDALGYLIVGQFHSWSAVVGRRPW